MSFEPGAPPPAGVVPLCVPHIDGPAWDYVKQCLDTNWVSSAGPFVDRFERLVADYLGVRHAVAVVNGTAALHTALLVAGVGPDDEVLVSTLTFIASANAVRYAGAWPVPIDAEPAYWQMDAQRVAEFVGRGCQWQQGRLVNKQTGRRVAAIVPVHILGHPVDLDPILEIGRRWELPVIEDAAEGLGAAYRGRRVGSLGDIACLSFNGNKIITTGGGGMVVTDNPQWAERARYLTTQARQDPLEYIHGALGYNYRLTNLQAALGCAQVERLDHHVARKRAIAATYAAALAGLPGLGVMPSAPWAQSACWLYTVLIDPAPFGMSSRDVLRQLEARGIQTRPLWQPVHQSPVHRGPYAPPCPVAERLHRDALSLPCSVGLSAQQQQRVVEALGSLAGRGASPWHALNAPGESAAA